MLTGHLVDGVFFSMAASTWDSLSVEQHGLVRSAAAAAVRFNNENRLLNEASLLDFFASKGMTITEPDVAAFRSHVQQQYLESDFSNDWPDGLIDRINAVQ